MQQVLHQDGNSHRILNIADSQEPKKHHNETSQLPDAQDSQTPSLTQVLGNKDDCLSTRPSDEKYPEGGWEAWLVVFGSFCGLFASLGLMNSIAILQTYLITHQLSNYSDGTIGWIFSLSTFFSFFCGIYVGPLFDKFGPKYLLLPGGIGIVLSIMLASLSTRELYKFHGLFDGQS